MTCVSVYLHVGGEVLVCVDVKLSTDQRVSLCVAASLSEMQGSGTPSPPDLGGSEDGDDLNRPKCEYLLPTVRL